MREIIIQKLKEIERTKGVSIIMAVESGSRAWGFHSADSDYDVRYIYVRPPRDYLTVHPKRDVIEGPADEVLDFSGWDLRKALGLMLKSNPCLFEWMSSDIVYLQDEYGYHLKDISGQYFQPVPAMYHYLSMCKHNYREHFRDGQAGIVKLKKYLYILRPILCCRWIEGGYTVPPLMDYGQLIASDIDLPTDVRHSLHDLAQRKRAGEELSEGAPVPCLNKFIDDEIARLPAVIKEMKRSQPDSERLDAFLFITVNALFPNILST